LVSANESDQEFLSTNKTVFARAAQFFKPFLDLNPIRMADIAMLTIRAVDSQQGEQVAGPASQVHNHLIHMFRRRDI